MVSLENKSSQNKITSLRCSCIFSTNMLALVFGHSAMKSHFICVLFANLFVSNLMKELSVHKQNWFASHKLAWKENVEKLILK